MSKKGKVIDVDEDISDIIYNFYDGNVYSMNKNNVNKLYNEGKINEKQYKYLKKIIKSIDKLPNARINLHERKEKDESKEDTSEKEETSVSTIDDKMEYISFQRKAFIEWINTKFYDNIMKQTDDSELNIWQIFVKNYLSLDTPYRGLLVYHGLGSGKTATAISTAEGLSESMNITTLLPASLETNFLNEVKRWGETTFDINKNKWSLLTDLDETFKKNLYETYSITPDIIDNIHTQAKNKSTDKSLIKGYWVVSDDGELNKNLSKPEQIYLELQIEVRLIIYHPNNFLHEYLLIF